MKDAQLVEARRDPEKKVEWAVTKLARLSKKKTIASKVLQVESSEPTTEAPPLTFLKWTRTCGTPKKRTIVL
jgi:hypothetical protein